MKAKAKGTRNERLIAKLHTDAGISARRVPFSGSIGTLVPELTSMKGDVQILGGEFVAEVKARRDGSGFKVIEKWLGENDMLFLRRDRQAPLVVLPWDVYVRLMKGYWDRIQKKETEQIES